MISVVINTRNEAANIRECLESVRWCDEIVVVDMESTDGTPEIARAYTEKVYSHPAVGYVEPARRFAVEQATGDWVLILDADELVPKSLADKFRAIEGQPDGDVYRIAHRNYLFGRWLCRGRWWPEYHNRFFRRDQVSYSDQIHSAIQPRPGARIVELPAEEQLAFAHFAYFSLSQFLEKLNRYTDFEVQAMRESGRTLRPRHLLIRPLQEFWSRYLWARGFEEGLAGFLSAGIMALYRAVVVLKYLEAAGGLGDRAVRNLYLGYKQSLIAEYEGTIHRASPGK